MSFSRVFVTGGAGFIGTRLVQALKSARPDVGVWVYDNLHPQVHGTDASPPKESKGQTFIYGDVRDLASLQDAISHAKPEVIYHLAAETGTGQSYDQPVRYCAANVVGTANLVEAVRRVGCVRKIVLSSSRAVYGEGGYRAADGREYVGLMREPDEMRSGNFKVSLPAGAEGLGTPIPSHSGLPPSPASVYASTKLMQEYLLSQLGVAANWKVAILRLQNVYGPGQSLLNPYTGVLSVFVGQLLSGKKINVYEDGQIARDFVYVDDVAEALMCAGFGDVMHGTIIDVGSGQATTILDVARMLAEILGFKRDSYYVSQEFRVGDIRHACGKIDKASELLGWSPRTDLLAGLTQFAEWAKNESKRADS